MRDAANSRVDAWPLNPSDRNSRLAKAARILRQTQRVNAAARTSHAKARHRRFRELGIAVQKLRCCIPPPSG